MITTKYSLPPPRLGNLDAEKRVDFVRASGKNLEHSGAPRDPDDIPEASTSAPIPNSELRSILEKSKKSLKTPKTEEIDEDDVIVLGDDVARREIKREEMPVENVDLRDLNRFLKAAKDGDLKEVRGLLEKKFPIDTADFYGWTATMCAAAEGNFEMCKLLLEHGADPGARDSRGRGILEIGKEKGHRLFAKRLIHYFCFPSDTIPSTSNSVSEQMTFCESCNTCIPETSVSAHISSIIHQLNDEKMAQGAAPQSGIQLGPSNIGYRLMCASGWTEEQGLGRNSDGHRFPIRTILKRNRTGLGLENPPKKVTHFGPFDKSSVRNERVQNANSGMSKKEIIRKKHKEDRIAKRFRADFADSDSVYDYFHGKS